MASTKKQVLIDFVNNTLQYPQAAAQLKKLTDSFLIDWVPKMKFEEFRKDNAFMGALQHFEFGGTNAQGIEMIFRGVYDAYVKDPKVFAEYISKVKDPVFAIREIGQYIPVDISKLVRYDAKAINSGNTNDHEELKAAVENGLAERQLHNITSDDDQKVVNQISNLLQDKNEQAILTAAHNNVQVKNFILSTANKIK